MILEFRHAKECCELRVVSSCVFVFGDKVDQSSHERWEEVLLHRIYVLWTQVYFGFIVVDGSEGEVVHTRLRVPRGIDSDPWQF